MLLSTLLIIIGIVTLFFGGESLVKGASQLAVRLGISPLIVGLTVVSLATSMPEAVSSFFARWMGGSGDMAIGNVLGSNIANIGLIAGISALVMPFSVCDKMIRRETPLMIAVTVAFAGLMALGPISRFGGLLLLLGLGAYLALQVRLARDERAANGEKREREPFRKELVEVVIGIGMLIIGGYCLIEGAVVIARDFGISERVIGITIVAIGTSCPELATSVVAAWRGHPEIAIGNVVGSNIFNLLFVVGGVATIFPIEFSPSLLWVDMPVALGFAIGLLACMLWGSCLSRRNGAILLGAYVAYILALIL